MEKERIIKIIEEKLPHLSDKDLRFVLYLVQYREEENKQ